MREGTEPDVETFRQLMWALCERRGTSPTPPQKDFFEHLWRTFQPSSFVRLFIAELGGRVISALLTIPFGDTVRAWKIGWAGDHAKSSPNAMLYWDAIRWSKRNGYRLFDLSSLSPFFVPFFLHFFITLFVFQFPFCAFSSQAGHELHHAVTTRL